MCYCINTSTNKYMTIKSEQVKNWRKNSKSRIVESMGGCCQICSYNKCHEALELHHIDPNEKEHSLSKLRANCGSWETVIKELRKCILLCSNCHREIHNDKAILPNIFTSFNEEFADYKFKQYYDKCPLCNNTKLKSHKYCSTKCSQQSKKKLDWESIDLLDLYSKLKTKLAVAEYLGVSDKTVAKYLKKLSS